MSAGLPCHLRQALCLPLSVAWAACVPRPVIGPPGNAIASVQQTHREACESSRRATSSLGLDDRAYGYRRGPLPLRWVHLHVLRELAQHCGHADILREQILNE